jgi:hypothetical protein
MIPDIVRVGCSLLSFLENLKLLRYKHENRESHKIKKY